MLVPLLPCLRDIQLYVQDDTSLAVVAALRGHPALQRLDIDFESYSRHPQQQPAAKRPMTKQMLAQRMRERAAAAAACST
jgi:hypothetical protein